ncbi:MAG: hypothetical protein M1839_006371 [Geoglossum umbratile]|nr:MAG: hypothetical protein M1839_006371 [Geoglossum umbratile]
MLFHLPTGFPKFSISRGWAGVKRKLRNFKRRNNPEPPKVDQTVPVANTVSQRGSTDVASLSSTPIYPPSDTSSSDGSPLLGDSATTPIPSKCLIMVRRTPPPDAVRSRTMLSSVPPANSALAPQNGISDDGSFIRNIDLHVANGDVFKESRRAKLDTGASMSIMSEEVRKDLGYKLEPYDKPFKPFNAGLITPLGVVRDVEWNFAGGLRTYVEDFYVFDTDEFDTLIGKHNLNDVLKYKSEERLAGAE